MKFEIIKNNGPGMFTYYDIRIGKLGSWWFIDNGEWFLYFQFGKRHYRFSSAGYLKFDQEDLKERLKQSLQEMKLMREGKLPKKTWDELKREIK